MASIHVIYDPNDRISQDTERDKEIGLKVARMALADDLESIDIYNVARKLSEMLLEQLPRT